MVTKPTIWPNGRFGVPQITPYTARDAHSLLELIKAVRDHVVDELHPNLQSAIDQLIVDVEAEYAKAQDQYVNGVERFQQIHDRFMSDVNAHMIALNDGAVTDLVEDDTSLLGKVLRTIFTDRAAFTELENLFTFRFDQQKQEHQNTLDGFALTMDSHQQSVAKQVGDTNDRVDGLAQLYPEHYGATGDGETDDTAALQTWADSGWSTLKPGSVYLTEQAITFTGNHRTLLGNGATIHHVGDTQDYVVSFTGDYATIDGVHLTGFGSGVDASGGISVDGDHAMIINNRIEDFTSSIGCMGIRIVGDRGGNHIANNVVRNLYADGDNIIGNSVGMCRGIYFHTPQSTTREQTTIANNTVTNIGGEEGDGIHVIIYNGVDNMPFGAAHTVVVDNTLTDCSRRYIKIQASDVVVKRNTMRETSSQTKRHPGPALNVIRGSRVDITDNDIQFSQHTGGIQYNGSNYRGNYITVSGNTIRTDRDVEKSCIVVDRVIYSTIADNVTVGGYRSLSLGNALVTTVSGNTAHDVASNTVIPNARAFIAHATCDRVIMINNVDASNFPHISFLNDSRQGITQNNVSLR